MTGDMDDFDKQMAEIDKAMAKVPPAQAPPPAAAPAGGKAAPTKRVTPSRLPAGGRREVISIWVRLVLVTLLAVGLTMWPYEAACGLGLAAYLAAVVVTIATGAFTAIATWRWRLAIPHGLSLAVTLAGLGMLAHEIAMRTGYAATTHTWLCP